MQIKCAIIGMGGHGRVLLDILMLQPGIQVVGFLDDDDCKLGKSVDNVLAIGRVNDVPILKAERKIDGVVLGIGDNYVRALLFGKMKEWGVPVFSAVHPRAIISRSVEIGEGFAVMAGVVINPGTRIGNNVCVNTGATVDHDNILEDHVHVYPGAHLVGDVTVKRYAYVRSGAIVAPCITIGENATVAAGAVVLEDVPDHAVVAGVPGKVVRYKEPQELGRLR